MPSITTRSDLRNYFLPYQIRWICDDHAFSVAEKSRRIGWTYASAFRAVERRVRLGTSLFYTSADLTAAREFMEDCCRWARVFQIVAEDADELILEEDGTTAYMLRFANGARIVAGSSRPAFLRGKGGDVDADEFAFHEQPRELYKAAQPAALMWGHQFRIWSTHNGSGSFFDQLVRNGRQHARFLRDDKPKHTDPKTATVAPRAESQQSADESETDDLALLTNQRSSVHRVTLYDAVNQGLVEIIRRLPAPDLNARRAFIEEIRASCPDEAAFQEEYLCQPAAEGSALLGYNTIAGCETANLTLADVESLVGDSAANLASPLYAGFDVGRRQDRSVLWVVERVGDVLWTRAIRVMGDASFAIQEEMLDRLLSARRVRRLCIDSTGIGMMLAERLRQRHAHRVEPIHFTADVKSELAMPLVRRFQEKLVRIPADSAIREDLHKVRRTVTAAHHIRLAAPRDADGHADRFWALALACHAAEQSPIVKTSSMLRKPVGW